MTVESKKFSDAALDVVSVVEVRLQILANRFHDLSESNMRIKNLLSDVHEVLAGGKGLTCDTYADRVNTSLEMLNARRSP